MLCKHTQQLSQVGKHTHCFICTNAAPDNPKPNLCDKSAQNNVHEQKSIPAREFFCLGAKKKMQPLAHVAVTRASLRGILCIH